MALRAGEVPEIDPRDPELPSVLAIVVTHNGREWLGEALAGLNAQTYGLLDVLVVDDATFDARRRPQIKRIAKRHLRGRRWGYLRTPRPLGMGGAINWAMSRVRTDADLLLFLHDDAALAPHAIEHMVARIIADEKTAIVGPKIVAWDDASLLEEVGMLIDRFGYPYKGLEEGEIDSGQHDEISEVFFVTSTCMLMRHDLFRQLKGWDASMRAYSEDLDLCWRARLMGYVVRVEPRAVAKHAVAMARGKRPSPFAPSRYYIRRNRFRTLVKNASALRLLAIVPQFLLLTLGEMLGFVILRQPREIINLARAIAWNTATLPQAITARAQVQRRRKVSDRKLRRLTVAQSKRVRFYVGHQRDRLEMTWGRRAELFSRRSSQVRSVGGQLRGWLGLAVVVVVIGILLGFRNIWWSPQLAVGELLPFPERTTGLWAAFASPWRGVGLGQAGSGPPALAILGFFQVIAVGVVGTSQKVMLVSLGAIAFVGAYRLVADLVDRPARFAAGAVYVFGPVGYAGLRSGSLGALMFAAAAPYVVKSMIRIAGWARPAGWVPSRAVARIVLGAAISAAFVPGALVLYAFAAVLLTVGRAVFVREERVPRSLILSLAGLAGGWALLLPWSAGWFSEGGVLDVLSGSSWRVFAANFSDDGTASAILGLTPEGPILAGLALPLLGLIAVVVGEGPRRRLGLALWAVIALTGLSMSMIASGMLSPFVASPVEAGVMIQVCFAGLTGLAVGAFRLDLPRRGFGLLHGATLAAVTASAVLLAGGLAPALWQGDWHPGEGSGREDEAVVSQIGSLFQGEAETIGQFRALWVGEGWTPPIPTPARPVGKEFVTSARGQVLANLFERHSGPGDVQLRQVIDSVTSGVTDRGGALLGAFNIHFVVVERSEETLPWLGQRDLGLVRSEPDYLVLRNDSYLARAGLYPELPSRLEALQASDPSLSVGPETAAIEPLDPESSSSYVSRNVSDSGTVFVAESADDGWGATLNGEELDRADAGWGNAFETPPGGSGRLEVSYPQGLGRWLWLVGLFIAWIVVVGASFSRRKRVAIPPRIPRRPPSRTNDRVEPPVVKGGSR